MILILGALFIAQTIKAQFLFSPQIRERNAELSRSQNPYAAPSEYLDRPQLLPRLLDDDQPLDYESRYDHHPRRKLAMQNNPHQREDIVQSHVTVDRKALKKYGTEKRNGSNLNFAKGTSVVEAPLDVKNTSRTVKKITEKTETSPGNKPKNNSTPSSNTKTQRNASSTLKPARTTITIPSQSLTSNTINDSSTITMSDDSMERSTIFSPNSTQSTPVTDESPIFWEGYDSLGKSFMGISAFLGLMNLILVVMWIFFCLKKRKFKNMNQGRSKSSKAPKSSKSLKSGKNTKSAKQSSSMSSGSKKRKVGGDDNLKEHNHYFVPEYYHEYNPHYGIWQASTLERTGTLSITS